MGLLWDARGLFTVKASRTPIFETIFGDSDQDVVPADAQAFEARYHGSIEFSFQIGTVAEDHQNLNEDEIPSVDISVSGIEYNLAFITRPEDLELVGWIYVKR